MAGQKRGDDRMSQALALLAPYVIALIDDWARPEFTTKQFIDNLLMEPEAQAAYLQAVSLWPDFPPNFGQKTVHGLVIPRLLRATGKAQWAGYIHGAAEDDGLGVPAKWRKVRETSSGRSPSQPTP
jgi:hypothetical protein